MFDDLHAYFYENVRLAYREFKDRLAEPHAGRSIDLRLAVVACSALFHLREHLPEAHALSRAAAEARCPDLALVGDIANVSKHRNITKLTPHGAPLLTFANQLHEVINIIRYEDIEGEYTCISKQVVAELSSGTLTDVMQALTSVLNFWEKYLVEIGVLNVATSHAYDDGLGYRPRSSQTVRPRFEVVQGLRFRSALQFMKFNPETGRAEPVSFPKGTKARIQIRERPRHQVDITIRHDESGREATRTITLTEDESEALDATPEGDRELLLKTFQSMRSGLNELVAEISRNSSGGEPEKRASK